MTGYAGANIILDDNDETRDFTRKIIRELTEDSADHDNLMELARETYETDRHAEVLGNKKIREMEKAHFLWENNGEYRVTNTGREAYEQAFNEELPEENTITKNLLNGGNYRNSGSIL